MSTRRPLSTLLSLFALLIFALFAGLPHGLGDDATPATPAGVTVVADAAPVATATAAAPLPAAAVALGGVSGSRSEVSGFAAQVAPVVPAMSPEVAVIAVVVPMLIAGLKQVAPSIPPVILPYLAPLVGLLLELALSRLGYTGGGGWLGGLIAGSAGVGIREHVDQLKKATGFPSLAASVALAPLLAIGLLGSAALLGSGCAVGRTIIDRETTTQSVTTNGVVVTATVREGTRTTAKTLFDAKFAQHAFKASQSTKSQTIGIGDQNQESTSDAIDKLVNGLALFGRLAAASQGIPLPQPAPVPVPVPLAPRAAPAPAPPPPSGVPAPTISLSPNVSVTPVSAPK